MPPCCSRARRSRDLSRPRRARGGGQGDGADALHPGYGFLSENPALAEACAHAGIVWVGPPAEAMRVMGHKARAKEVVAAAGVPVLPSAVLAPGRRARAGAPRRRSATRCWSRRRPAGEGGACASSKRPASSPTQWRRPSARPRRVRIGRGLRGAVPPDPRHVEVQVIGDTHGTVLHLFDRECSVQRRHQKVVEEAPAVFVPDATRRVMWEAAVAAARAVGYVGAARWSTSPTRAASTSSR